ncbi:MAG: OB-fold domain-containing protein [Gemmatimonadota bacterium]
MSQSVRDPLDFAPDDLDRPFWEGCRRHEFLLQRSGITGRYYWPAVCDPESGREGMEWVRASGRGVIHTFSIVHQAYRPDLVDRVPYNVVVVELEEGPFFHSNVVDCPNEAIHIGMPVEVVFDDISDEVTLPRFRPLQQPGSG